MGSDCENQNNNRQRNDRGQFRSEHPDQEFLDLVAENQPATTKEVADGIGCSRRNADYRLRRLADDGRVSKKKAGTSLVWMVENENN